MSASLKSANGPAVETAVADEDEGALGLLLSIAIDAQNGRLLRRDAGRGEEIAERWPSTAFTSLLLRWTIWASRPTPAI